MAYLKIKHSKCEFVKTKVCYLDYLVGSNGVQPLPEKIEAIRKLIASTNVDGLQQFLGLVRFYRKFIPSLQTIQCDSAYETLKDELCKMPTLQYRNPKIPYKLFTDGSKCSYSRILHQEKEGKPDTIIQITYFFRLFWKNTATLEYNAERMLHSLQICIKVSFYLTGAECTLYCDHKPLASFLITGMLSHVLDRWALELQQFNIEFNYIEGKKNIVADAISRLKTLNLYEKHQEVDSVPSVAAFEDALENIIEEVQNISVKASNSNQTTQLNLNDLHREQKQDQFCINKAKSISADKPSDFILGNSGILRKIVNLKYTIESTIVIPKIKNTELFSTS